MNKVYERTTDKYRIICETREDAEKILNCKSLKYVGRECDLRGQAKYRTSKDFFRYYQPNELDKKHETGDCVIRALSKVLNLSWVETYDALVPIGRELHENMDLKCAVRLLETNGFVAESIKVTKGSKRPTVESFAKEHPQGKYFLQVASHVVAVVDGFYYDTWNCGASCLYKFWKEV